MAGWIKIHRDIANHWIFQDAEKFKWWIDLLFMASYEDTKVLVGNQLQTIKKGQLIASLDFLAKRWQTSKRTVLKFLVLLESDGMCFRSSNRKVTVITICNYESYQEVESTKVTDKYPIGNRCVTENKKLQEIQEINITTTAQAHTHTCEEFANRYRAENNWSEVGILIHAKGIDDCKSLFEEFVASNKHDGKTWSEYNDFKRHFRQWATQRVQKREKTTQNHPAQKKVISGKDIFNIYGDH